MWWKNYLILVLEDRIVITPLIIIAFYNLYKKAAIRKFAKRKNKGYPIESAWILICKALRLPTSVLLGIG